MFTNGEEEEEEMDPNDLNWLPIEYRNVYRRPNIILALEEGSSISQVKIYSYYHTYDKSFVVKLSIPSFF